MTDYIKREDAINFIANGVCTDTEADMKYTINKFNDDIPSADVVEVVRCKDCKYMLQYEQIKACCNVNSFLQEPKCVSDNDFCSRGEPKDEIC